ncbi:hypothetical protein LX36DRAFT_658451 [Colletotrichum falcatum]|nr:hypothetical protein LX36DRAFT_658451 [Colletotrichum falcatum]
MAERTGTLVPAPVGFFFFFFFFVGWARGRSARHSSNQSPGKRLKLAFLAWWERCPGARSWPPIGLEDTMPGRRHSLRRLVCPVS